MPLDPKLAKLLGPEITQYIAAVEAQDLDITEPFPQKRYACAMYSLAVVTIHLTSDDFTSIVHGFCICFPERADEIMHYAKKLRSHDY